MAEVKFQAIDEEDGDVVTFSFKTVNRDEMIKKFVEFMRAAGWGMPNDIEDEISDLIADIYEKKHTHTV